VFSSPGDLAAPAGYSHVVSIPSGRLVWTSGQVPMDTERKIVGAGDWAAQTRAVFGNLERALRAGGAGWADVVKLMLFVVDVSELDTIRAVRDEFVDTANPPASSLVQVAGLFHPDVLIEVEAVAWRPG
jgi:enamine deaminase RidA (YjgF/YER057c/UK114 family)